MENQTWENNNPVSEAWPNQNLVNQSVSNSIPVNNPQPQKSNSLLVIILSILLLISLSLAGYFYYQLQKVNNDLKILNDELTQKQIQTVTPTTEPAVTNEFADWKAYNGLYFSFKYPNNWYPSSDSSLEYKDPTQEKLGMPEESPDFPRYSLSFGIKYGDIDSRLKSVSGLNPQKVTYGEIQGYSYKMPAPPGGLGTQVLIPKDDKIYEFYYGNFTHQETWDKYLDTFNKILSTLKFTN